MVANISIVRSTGFFELLRFHQILSVHIMCDTIYMFVSLAPWISEIIDHIHFVSCTERYTLVSIISSIKNHSPLPLVWKDSLSRIATTRMYILLLHDISEGKNVG